MKIIYDRSEKSTNIKLPPSGGSRRDFSREILRNEYQKGLKVLLTPIWVAAGVILCIKRNYVASFAFHSKSIRIIERKDYVENRKIFDVNTAIYMRKLI